MNFIKESYETIYEKCYKKLPWIIAGITGALFFLVGFIEVCVGTEGFGYNYEGLLQGIVGSMEYISAILASFVWLIVAVVGFCVALIISKIVVSQKIMVVQRLTEIGKKDD